MGAITFSLDPALLKALRSALPLTLFVETGTFRGDTLENLKSEFHELISIELSQDLYSQVLARFRDDHNIRLIQGDSAEALLGIADTVRGRSTLFWLDAHWCVATGTAGETSQCPLLEELKAIGDLNDQSVVLIDDARFFMAPPPAPHEVTQWPTFDQILQQLRAMAPAHEIMVVNDVIALFPLRAKQAMATFAQEHGADWLLIAHLAGQMSQLEVKEAVIQQMHASAVKQNEQLEAKESVIQQMRASAAEQNEQLEAKEAVIQQMHASAVKQNEQLAELKQYRDLFYALPRSIRWIARANWRDISTLSPRLGNMNQYKPRPMTQVKALSTPAAAAPRISIVTPSYGQSRYIERTLLSVLDQNYPNLEYVVKDGGSNDETVQVLEAYSSRLASWESCRDNGRSDAINKGFSRTSGDIMAWLNSDDLLLPGSLARVEKAFRENPQVEVIYGNRLLIDENDMEIGRWIMPGHDARVLSWVDYIPQETLFWRRSIWEKCGGIDDTFGFALDWDLLVRFRDAGAKFLHIPEFLGASRIHEQQKTSAVISQIGFQEMDRIRLRTLGRVPTQKEIRRATTGLLIRHSLADLKYRIVSKGVGRRGK